MNLFDRIIIFVLQKTHSDGHAAAQAAVIETRFGGIRLPNLTAELWQLHCILLMTVGRFVLAVDRTGQDGKADNSIELGRLVENIGIVAYRYILKYSIGFVCTISTEKPVLLYKSFLYFFPENISCCYN